MKAMPVSWHEECLKNATFYHRKRRERIECELLEEKREENRLIAYSIQIQEAKRMKKDRFNREKFMAKKMATYAAQKA